MLAYRRHRSNKTASAAVTNKLVCSRKEKGRETHFLSHTFHTLYVGLLLNFVDLIRTVFVVFERGQNNVDFQKGSKQRFVYRESFRVFLLLFYAKQILKISYSSSVEEKLEALILKIS